MMLKYKAALILLLEGLASSGLQMITIRQTAPYVGSSVLTTSIVISCFLGALALGYYWGGKKSSAAYSRTLIINLLFSISLFGIGLSYVFVNLFFETIIEMTPLIPTLHNPLVHLFAFCLLIMSPLVFFLGQTVPLLLHTSNQDTNKSEAAGNATALSTVGNVLGCLLTSLVIMYFLGVGYSIFINCLILASCLVFLLNWQSTKSKFIIAIALISLSITYVLNIKVSNSIFAETTPYSNFNVADHPKGKRFIINRSSASFIGKEDRKGWPYIEMIKDGIFSDDASNKEILVLGAGGFTLSAETQNGAHFTYIDIDSKIKPVAEDLFLGEPISGQFIAHDARNFLLANKEAKWDSIVVDLYSNAATIPMHTSTFEFFSLVESRIKDNGRVILNVAANPMLNDSYSANMDKTIRSALSRCITDLTQFRDELVNIVYYCSKNNQTVTEIYRDNNTKAAVDGYIASMKTKQWEE
ncbi:fused MFS/spermidine synthase [Alkalimarinus alittae]|uniref:Fused MFS/spermidine synthase n=1 Tax=Alkalimarinus alittae TaxID=2961619 RepID=A0ABY6N559_9ALTE|nr:fused MFS/spermidine synthase [Alkalimarinus alittae]UZE97251.1 fused MFS/spermidine synthase [Alkalimarinus alittae]